MKLVVELSEIGWEWVKAVVGTACELIVKRIRFWR